MVGRVQARIAEIERHERSARRHRRLAVALGVAALLVSIVALLVGPAISDYLTKPSTASMTRTLLSDLRAGQTLKSFSAVLGEPTSERPITGSPWTFSVFVRDNYAVATTSDAAGKVVVFSVLSCDPELKPQFTTNSNTVVHLGDQSISLAETSQKPDARATPEVLNDRSLNYQNPGSGRQSSQFLELTRDGPRSGNDNHLYGLGLSGQCNDEYIPDLTPDDPGKYIGGLPDAPASVREFRRTTAPNFYSDIDTQFYFEFSVDDHGYGVFTDHRSTPASVIDGVPLSLHSGEVPFDFGK
ncbi:hypothetical protein [Cryobacterium mannosilyticum]|uniref:Uncharacterized protein n=1 Tax=Cryobacterium mannosilyticum TaxID=1259190 RepID=A0A4R8W8W4_9MICO|nr:hypothetical protein [Cryobacterium mannosilyticum]TFC02635.1 hypothetical protein E3O32_11305 [Cryobacterium mannosilyticum]